MALEGILEKLSVEKDGEFKASDKYDSQVLYGASEGLSELDKTNLDSKEGLANYKTLTRDNPSKYSHQKLTFRKDMRLRGGQEDFGAYVDKNFEKIIDELEEPIQTSIAYKYCPTKDVSGDKAKPYNETRKTVSDAKETIKKINEKPDEYIKEEMEKETPLMAKYIARYAEEFLEIEKSEAQYGAVQAIQKYKALKFITDTRKHLIGQSTELREKESALQNAITEKLKSARGLTSEARAKLISEEYKQLEKLSEDYIDVELGNKLTNETVSNAIEAIKGKYETAPNIYDILKQYPDRKAPSRNERTPNTPTRQSNENLEERMESNEDNQTNENRTESSNQEQGSTSETPREDYQTPTNTEEQSQPREQTRTPENTRRTRPQRSQERTQPAQEQESAPETPQETPTQNTPTRTQEPIRTETVEQSVWTLAEEVAANDEDAGRTLQKEYRERETEQEVKRQEMYITNFEKVILGEATLNKHKGFDKYDLPILDVTSYSGKQPEKGK